MTDFWFWFMLALLAEVFLLMVAAFGVAVAYQVLRARLEQGGHLPPVPGKEGEEAP